MRPCVSVVVSVYNEENYIKECIDSIVAQSLRNIEIILVDDGSKDLSGSICDEYAALDERIKVIHKKNEGLGMARNTGIKAASGEFIAFVDSDDYISKEMYENMYNKAVSYNADTCLCGFQSFNNKGKKKCWPLRMDKDVYKNHEIKNYILLNMIGALPEGREDDVIGMSVWKGIYSSKIIFENGIAFVSEREFISEDIIFNIDYIKNSKICVVDENPYYHYRNNLLSLTNTYLKERFFKEKILYYELVEKLKTLKIYDKAQIRLSRMFIARVRICLLHEVKDNKNLRQTLKRIKFIANDSLLQNILEEYPIRKLPLIKGIFSYAEKFKLYMIIFLLCRAYLIIRGKYE